MHECQHWKWHRLEDRQTTGNDALQMGAGEGFDAKPSYVLKGKGYDSELLHGEIRRGQGLGAHGLMIMGTGITNVYHFWSLHSEKHSDRDRRVEFLL